MDIEENARVVGLLHAKGPRAPCEPIVMDGEALHRVPEAKRSSDVSRRGDVSRSNATYSSMS